MERSKAAEAFNYLSSVQAAQERYHARQGTYADKSTDLDIKLTARSTSPPARLPPGDQQPAGLLDADADPDGGVRRLRGVHRDLHRGGLRPGQQHDQRHADINPMQT